MDKKLSGNMGSSVSGKQLFSYFHSPKKKNGGNNLSMNICLQNQVALSEFQETDTVPMIHVKINQDFHWQNHSLFIFSLSTPFILKTVILSFNCHFRAIAEMVSSLYIDWDNRKPFRNLHFQRNSIPINFHCKSSMQLCCSDLNSIFTLYMIL